MNQISEIFAFRPLKYPRELIQALEKLGGGMVSEQRREGQKFPWFNQSQESGVWRFSRVGSIPREDSGGRDHCMRSTSGKGGRLDLVGGREIGGGWQAIKECLIAFHLAPSPNTQTHSVPCSNQSWIIWG